MANANSQELPSCPRFVHSGPSADVVDAFGRVHIRHPEDGDAGRGAPTVLTKLKKWADYASVGEPVYPTKFLPMKTPMSEEIIQNWSLEHPPTHVLTVRRLIETQERDHGRKVGLIIDLANHDCLYIDDLLKYNEEVGAVRDSIVEYVHVGLVAKELPPQEVIDQVQEVARGFWERKPDSFICLHCCYGFNRTGYVLCSYLCQVHGMSVQESLESFARARGPGVKHKKFIEALQSKYGRDGGIHKHDGYERPNWEASTRDTPWDPREGRAGDNEVGHDEAEWEPGEAEDAGSRREMGSTSTASSPLASTSRSNSADSLTLMTTPQGSRMKLRPASHPIGILTKSAPSSMRRPQTSSSRDLLGDESTWSAVSPTDVGASVGRTLSRSCNSTGGMLESEDFDRLADTLKFNSAMRREVHVGLAKALHNDFGRHDWSENEMLEDEGDTKIDDKIGDRRFCTMQ